MKVQANNMTIFWNGSAIAYATTAELDVNCDSFEVGSADNGNWLHYITGRRGWRLSAGYLVDVRPARMVENYRNGFEMLTDDTQINIAFGTIDDHGIIDAKDQTPNGAAIYTGAALVRRYTEQAVRGQYVACQFEAVGDGPLKQLKNES